MKALITLLSFLFSLPMLSQEPHTYKIMVKERTSVKGEYKELELLSTNNQKILIIKNQKKERLPLNEKDSLRFVTIMKNYDKKLEKEFISLGEKTLAFELDTVHLRKEHPLYNTTDNFFKNRKKIKKQLTEKEDNRIILDGTTYQIIITDSMGETDVFYAHSPTENSHPNIFELLSAFRSTYKTPQP